MTRQEKEQLIRELYECGNWQDLRAVVARVIENLPEETSDRRTDASTNDKA